MRTNTFDLSPQKGDIMRIIMLMLLAIPIKLESRPVCPVTQAQLDALPGYEIQVEEYCDL
jgi:hypothetical protein